ncbi:hypothetical protein Tco_0396306 [Tanacetum coccineum]
MATYEQWFTLNVNLLRKALEITPVDPAHPFASPPAGEYVMNFVNKLGYPEEIHFGIIIRTNVDYTELIWEEFVQAIQIFFAHQANLNVPTKKPTPHVIPYCRFTKFIIFYLGSEYNIHKRPRSLVHVTRDDYLLGNLKFIPKGEKDEVFGKPNSKELITESIRNSSYYQQYLEMVARKPTTKEGGQKKTAFEADKPKKPTPFKKPAPAKQTKPVKQKTTQPYLTKKIRKGKVAKIRKGKSSLQLVDEDEEVQHEHEPQIEDDEYNLQRGKSTTDQYIFQRRTPVTEEASTRPLAQPEDDTSANIVRDTLSPPDAETGAEGEMSDNEGDTEILNVGEEEGEDVSNTMVLEEKQLNLMKARLDQALIIHSSLNLHQIKTRLDQTLDQNPPSSSGTLSSMKNFDDAFTYGDQFQYDKPMEEDPDKVNVETEVESMVTIPIHQASLIAPPLSTPVIDLTQPKPVSPPIQEPIFTATTTTTTTTLPPPPPPSQQQITTNLTLDARVSVLEQICANFEKKNKVQDQTTQALLSRIFMLENHDLYLKIDKYINENVKEAVQNALKALVRERFKELSEFEMKNIIHDRMFKSGSYRSQPEHTALYEALEASMDRENMEEFMDATAKSRKRYHDEQDPSLPPPKDSDQNDVQILDSENVGTANLPKIKTRPDWLKLVLEEEKPETLESKWVIPPNDLPEPENNWANAIAKSYKDPEENNKADLEGPAFKVVRLFHENSISLQFQMEECHLLLTDQIDLVNPEGNKERRNDLSISKLKAAFYQDFRLEELVPSLWIESERDYDISAAYVKSHMKILSVVSLKTFSRYDYTFLREIVLRKAEYKEYKISKADFKDLHLDDFVDMYLLYLQGKLNHLSGSDKVHLFNAVNLWIRNIVIRKRVEDLQLGIKSYQTKLNLIEPSWDATDFLFKEVNNIVSKPRAVIYRDRNNQKKMMRESKVHKFSDGTLTRILEKLDHMVKDFVLFKFNHGMEHRIWSEDEKRRSKEFIEVIGRRLKIRRIFRSLESFVSGRLQDVDYRLIQRTE